MNPFFGEQTYEDFYVVQEGRTHRQHAGPFSLEEAQNVLDNWRNACRKDRTPVEEFPKIIKTTVRISNSVVEGV